MIFSFASGLADSIYGKSLDPIRFFLEKEEEAYSKIQTIKLLFNVINSDKYGEKFTEITSKGNFEPVGEGGAYPRTSEQEGFSRVIYPEEWKNSFEITETSIEDTKMYDARSRAANFMVSYTRTRELFAINFLQYGNVTKFTFMGKEYGAYCKDGLPLFSAVHPSATKNTADQSNVDTLLFSYDNLAVVEERMQKFTDHDGNLLYIQPDTIVIPNNASIKKLVADAIFTDGPGKKPGDIEAGWNFHGERWNVIVNPLLKAPEPGKDPWFVLDSKRNKIDGLIWVDRVPLSVRSWVRNENGNNVWGGRARFGAGANNWTSWYGNFPV